ncbi:MAG: response regulator [Dehalococcoidia bacterium]|nr:response regulator [Dehalococcoidia bacterium]
MKNSGVAARRILVVEDEPVISRVCVQSLTGEGLEVDVAVNGSVAEGMLWNRDYDLILIDIRTPVMNGKQLYQSITEKHPELVRGVIFTTGDVMGSDTENFLKQSGRLFLLKPFAPNELVAVVRDALRRLER